MKKPLLWGLCAVVALFGVVCWLKWRSRDQLTTVMRIGVLRHESTLPYYVAESAGYFNANGVRVELIELPPADHLPALIAQRVDLISPTSFSTLLGVMAEHPESLYAFLPGAESSSGPPVYGIITRKDFPGSSLKDLTQGVIMAINPFTKVNLQMIYSKIGIPKDAQPDIRVASREVALQAVLKGEARGAILDQPALAVALQEPQLKLLEANPRAKYVGSPYWSGAGAVTRVTWQDRTDDMRKISKALDAAIDDIRRDPNAAHAILAEKLALPADIADKIGGYIYAKSTEGIDLDGIAATVEALFSADLLKKRIDPAQLFPHQYYGLK